MSPPSCAPSLAITTRWFGALDTRVSLAGSVLAGNVGGERRSWHDGFMRVFLGSDHAGFELKTAVIRHLSAAGNDVIDCGALSYDPDDDYPPYCIAVGESVVGEPGSLGLVIGGSGNGEQIAANKVRGVRAALGWSLDTARLAREHNNANVLGVGARMHSTDEALAIIDQFLATPFSAESRHQRRIDLLSAYENPA